MTVRVRVRRLPMVVAALVAVAVLVLGVFPTRSYVAQRRDIGAAEARVEVLRAENERLRSRLGHLETDAEIERLAREQYGLVKPGEEAYAILPSPEDPDPPPGTLTAEDAAADSRPGVWSRLGDLLTFWN